jgi:hypothetical protein
MTYRGKAPLNADNILIMSRKAISPNSHFHMDFKNKKFSIDGCIVRGKCYSSNYTFMPEEEDIPVDPIHDKKDESGSS